MTESFICDKIRFLRNKKGISAREMSLELEQNTSYINKIETGQHSLSMPAFFKICEYFGISPAQFFMQNETEVLSKKEQRLLDSFRRLTAKQADNILSIATDLSKN